MQYWKEKVRKYFEKMDREWNSSKERKKRDTEKLETEWSKKWKENVEWGGGERS